MIKEDVDESSTTYFFIDLKHFNNPLVPNANSDSPNSRMVCLTCLLYTGTDAAAPGAIT